MSDWKKGRIIISCPQCGLDRGKEVGGLGTACPKCGFKPERELTKKERDKKEMTENLKKAYCPHFREVMDLNDCFFCYFKKVKKR